LVKTFDYAFFLLIFQHKRFEILKEVKTLCVFAITERYKFLYVHVLIGSQNFGDRNMIYILVLI